MVDFLVIGPVLNVTDKNIFHLIKYGDISFGWNRVVEFDSGVKFGNIRWFSNISNYCHPPLVLSRKYVEGEYKKFDGTDIINIDKTKDIPYDYYDVMAVPITFLDKWNPGQFEIVDTRDNIGESFDTVDGRNTYNRILIKKISG